MSKRNPITSLLSMVLVLAMVLSMATVAFAAETTLEAGKNYTVDAKLSCYVNAMGGVEFSDGYGLLKSTTVSVDENGDAYLTMNLGTTSGLAIYGVACTAFIGTDEAPGYYADGAVTKENVTYTVSENTVANAKGQVNYIDSITMPVDSSVNEYTLWIYLDSNVMGCQLGDGTGTGSSNTPGVATKHTAKLTIDWDTLAAGPAETSNQTANVELNYTATGTYEVSIPSTINVDKATLKGTYEVTAKNFDINTDAYVTVTADTEGTLKTEDNKTTSFTNTLAEGQLKATGDTLAGTVTVDKPSANGNYTGSLNFVISYYSGE